MEMESTKYVPFHNYYSKLQLTKLSGQSTKVSLMLEDRLASCVRDRALILWVPKID